ncbi:inosine triphosphate pyrophosphatase-like [Schistocerca gregaria]|uniref:inosine triphosphate pyrophosphatase-like n=1 Tax=Schistocerca gregaria TaxID=7010 RepID=UPI00211F44EE|nr:inosine triphosphate pyrophosphatase-like [Schistocerca gregaria]
MTTKKPITFVTGNNNKLKEAQAILGDSSNIVSAKIDLPELQGDARDIVREKCLCAARKVNGPVIVEDTSLCFNALNGLPGPYIKWFLDKIGLSGLMQMLSGFSDHSAYAMCIYAFTLSADDEPVLFEGRTNGIIVPARPQSNNKSFGWDPIFQPCDEDQPKGIQTPLTYAEMDKAVKNTISHRFRSLNKLKAYLSENGILA